MTLAQVAIDVFMSFGVLAAVVFCGYRVVGWARRQQKRAYVLGVLFTPFIALGNVSDPDFRVVNQAKQHKQRDEDEPGDPPTLEDETEPESTAVEAAPPRSRAKRKAGWSIIRSLILRLKKQGTLASHQPRGETP